MEIDSVDFNGLSIEKEVEHDKICMFMREWCI